MVTPRWQLARGSPATWISEQRDHLEGVLKQALPGADVAPRLLHEAMHYAVMGGGKRIRGLLAYAAGALAGAEPCRVDSMAAAVELIHAYSLIHDDLPCMDDDVLRRGKPTCHVAFGEAMALLAGDALQALAFAEVARTSTETSVPVPILIGWLATAVGSAGMVGGQAMDMDSVASWVELDTLEQMHRRKTGALIRTAIRLGAACGRPLSFQEQNALDDFGGAIGLAFQIVDDVLDAESNTVTLGKTVGKDAAQSRSTYVTLLGVEAAKTRLRELQEQAGNALLPFGSSADRLSELAHWIVAREH